MQEHFNFIPGGPMNIYSYFSWQRVQTKLFLNKKMLIMTREKLNSITKCASILSRAYEYFLLFFMTKSTRHKYVCLAVIARHLLL